jgi:hypothetical protein
MRQLPRLAKAASAVAFRKPVFIKPARGHPFQGFVLPRDPRQLDAHAKTQLNALLALPPDEPVWVAEPVEIVSEWRYLVLRSEAIGAAPLLPARAGMRQVPALEELSGIIAALPSDAAFAADLAVLADGETTLLCVRDPLTVEGPADGRDGMAPLTYVDFLWTRWSQVAARRGRTLP